METLSSDWLNIRPLTCVRFSTKTLTENKRTPSTTCQRVNRKAALCDRILKKNLKSNILLTFLNVTFIFQSVPQCLTSIHILFSFFLIKQIKSRSGDTVLQWLALTARRLRVRSPGLGTFRAGSACSPCVCLGAPGSLAPPTVQRHACEANRQL